MLNVQLMSVKIANVDVEFISIYYEVFVYNMYKKIFNHYLDFLFVNIVLPKQFLSSLCFLQLHCCNCARMEYKTKI